MCEKWNRAIWCSLGDKCKFVCKLSRYRGWNRLYRQIFPIAAKGILLGKSFLDLDFQVDPFSSIAQIAQFFRPPRPGFPLPFSHRKRNQLKIGQRSSLFRVVDNIKCGKTRVGEGNRGSYRCGGKVGNSSERFPCFQCHQWCCRGRIPDQYEKMCQHGGRSFLHLQFGIAGRGFIDDGDDAGSGRFTAVSRDRRKWRRNRFAGV